MNIASMFITGMLILHGMTAISHATPSSEESQEEADKDTIAVKTESIHLQNYKEFGEFFGTVEGIREANLICHNGGHVNKIYVKSGDRVRKGQQLCNIDTPIYQTRYDSAILAENLARKEHERVSRHLKNGNASEVQAEKSKLDWLQSTTRRLEAKKMLDSASCESPIDGIVTTVNIRLFEEIPPGSPSIGIADISEVRLVVGLPESEANLYTKGRPVIVSLNSDTESQWEGTLDNVALRMNQNNKTFAAEIFVKNHDLRLRPGLTVRARILKYDLKDQVVIAPESILIRSNEKVVMVREGNTAQLHPVKVLTSYGNKAVIESGLKAGDELIIKGHSQVVEGSPLRVILD
ncbi:MAG: efflux RND transporter periplasmic adaptor subunit [Deltaproteobacteria bacterium]|nr:efflux RND transporter periplasmic adaptor subunit [Deltaproteobacteria bacterium]